MLAAAKPTVPVNSLRDHLNAMVGAWCAGCEDTLFPLDQGGYAVKDFGPANFKERRKSSHSARWEGEAPVEPHLLARGECCLRFGMGRTLPSRRNILHGIARRGGIVNFRKLEISWLTSDKPLDKFITVLLQ